MFLGKTMTAAELETFDQELRMRGPFPFEKTWKVHVSFETDPRAEDGRQAAAVRQPDERATAVLQRHISMRVLPNESPRGEQITLRSDSPGPEKQVGGFRSRLRLLVARFRLGQKEEPWPDKNSGWSDSSS